MTSAPPPNGTPRRGLAAAGVDVKKLPHNEESEAGILGGILLRNSVLELLELLDVEDFIELRNRTVFEAMRNLQHRKQPIDLVTLEVELERIGKFEAIGGIAYLGELVLRVPTPDNVAQYAKDVRGLAKKRRVILALASATERAMNWPHDPDELLGEVLGQLGRVDEHRLDPRPIEQLLIDPYRALEMLEPFRTAPIYETPWPEINAALGFGGAIGTQVYTVAAGTGVGKSTWISACSSHVAGVGIPTVVATWEMEPGYFVARRSAGFLGVHSNDIMRGTVAASVVLPTISADLGKYLRYLDHPTLAQLEQAIEWATDKYGKAPLVVVDYIQKLADMVMATQQRPDMRLATTLVSTELLAIAKRQRCAIFCVSAIGRGKGNLLDNPRKKHPSQLVEVAKESGAIEYDGGGVIVLSVSHEMDGDEAIATMTVAKARFGTVCHIDARYHGARGLWRTLDVVPWDRTKPAKPADDADKGDAELREAIASALRANPGMLGSATDIWKKTGRGKKPVLAMVKAMIADNSIELREGGYAVKQGHQQTEIGGIE